MRFIAVLISCFMMVVTCLADVAPESVVQNFYSLLLKLKVSGLPNEDQLKELSPYLSTGLLRQMGHAQKYQEKFMKAHPHDKSPLIEGDLFSSLFEGITQFQMSHMEPLKDGYRVYVDFSYADLPLSREITRWQDAVIVRKEGERFVIDDVEYLGNWPFKPGNKLSEVLDVSR